MRARTSSMVGPDSIAAGCTVTTTRPGGRATFPSSRRVTPSGWSVASTVIAGAVRIAGPVVGAATFRPALGARRPPRAAQRAVADQVEVPLQADHRNPLGGGLLPHRREGLVQALRRLLVTRPALAEDLRALAQ